MKRSKRVTAIAACFVGSLVFASAGVAALDEMGVFAATTETVSMEQLIVNPSENVSLTTGQSIALNTETANGGNFATVKGLYVAPWDKTPTQVVSSDKKTAWSADINSRFTGTTSIDYYLPENADNGETMATAFTVKNSDGVAVAKFVRTYLNKNPHHYELSRAFVYDVENEKYTTNKYAGWVNNGPTSYINETQELTMGESELQGFSSYTCVSPKFGTYYNVGNLVEEETPSYGTVYFVYENKTLTIKTSTYWQKDKEYRENSCCTGNVVTQGVIANVDLSNGYTISMGDAFDIKGTNGASLYQNTSSVLLMGINEFSAGADTAEKGSKRSISYYAESEVNGEHVITVTKGASLNKFDLAVTDTFTDNNGKSIDVGYSSEKFNWDGNKAFNEEETITVSHQGASKQYRIKINSNGVIAAKDVLTNLEACKDSLQTKYSLKYTGSVDQTVNGVLIGVTNKSWSADINGVFTGNSSITYALPEGTTNKSMSNAFTVKDTSGNVVASVYREGTHWSLPHTSAAYVYDAIAKKYTTARGYWSNTKYWYNGEIQEIFVNSDEKEGDTMGVTGDMAVSPKYGSEFNGAIENDPYGTLYFEYADNQLVIKTTIYNVKDSENYDGKTITLGIIDNVDLTDGYTITIGSAHEHPANKSNLAEDYFYENRSSILLVAINGVSISDNMVNVTGVSEKIVPQNTVGNDGVIVLDKGEELSFKSESSVLIGSLKLHIDGTTTSVVGSIADYGDEASVTVRDFVVRKDFDVRVKTLTESLSGTEMEKGAYIRATEPYGIRFSMNVSVADKEKIDAAISDAVAYTAVRYGMLIMPYSYIATYGDINEENLFGENAKYTWTGKDGVGNTQIMVRYSETGLQLENGTYKLHYSCVGLQGEAIKTTFVSAGIVELTKADGTKEYKVVSRYADYAENKSETNVRSCYEVAKAAYEDESANAPSTELKKFLLENYLKPFGYEESEGGAV